MYTDHKYPQYLLYELFCRTNFNKFGNTLANTQLNIKLSKLMWNILFTEPLWPIANLKNKNLLFIKSSFGKKKLIC